MKETVNQSDFSKIGRIQIKASISIRNINDTWTSGSKTVTFADKNQRTKLAAGFAWKDSRGRAMWKDGAVVTGGSDFGASVNGLGLHGLDTPEIYFIGEGRDRVSSNIYLNLNGSTHNNAIIISNRL